MSRRPDRPSAGSPAITTASAAPAASPFDALLDLRADIDAALEASDGELSPPVLAMLDTLGLHERAAVDAYREPMEFAQTMVRAATEKAKAIAGRKRAWERAYALRERALLAYMRLRGLTRLAGDTTGVQVVDDGGKAPVILTAAPDSDGAVTGEAAAALRAAIPARFLVESVRVDKEALRAALEAGDPEAQAVATVGMRGQHLLWTT